MGDKVGDKVRDEVGVPFAGLNDGTVALGLLLKHCHRPADRLLCPFLCRPGQLGEGLILSPGFEPAAGAKRDGYEQQ